RAAWSARHVAARGRHSPRRWPPRSGDSRPQRGRRVWGRGSPPRWNSRRARCLTTTWLHSSARRSARRVSWPRRAPYGRGRRRGAPPSGPRRLGAWRLGWRVREILDGLVPERRAHDRYPDRKRHAGAGFLGAEGPGPVVADPHSSHERGREADEPGVREVVRGAGLARQWSLEHPRPDRGAPLHDTAQHLGQSDGGSRIDPFPALGDVLLDEPALRIGDVAHHERLHVDALIGEGTVGGGE